MILEVLIYLFKNSFNCMALNLAIKWGNLIFVKFLIEKCGANVNNAGAEDRSPLHKAASGGNIEIVKYLHQNGADLEAKTKLEIGGKIFFDKTPLHLAVNGGHIEVVKYLHQNGADLNAAANFDKITPLHLAVALEHIEIVKYLHQNGADPEAESIFFTTPVSMAIKRGHVEVVKYFHQNGHLLIPLHTAAYWKQLNVVKYLIHQAGFDVNTATAHDGRTALHYVLKMLFNFCIPEIRQDILKW